MKQLLMVAILALSSMVQPVYSQGKNHHIVFIPKSSSDLAFWKIMRQGCDKAVQ